MLKMPLLGSMLKIPMDLDKANLLSKTSRPPSMLTIKTDTTYHLPLLNLVNKTKIKSNLINLEMIKEITVSNLTMVKPHLLNNLHNTTLHGTNGANPNGKQAQISTVLNQNQVMTSATE